MISELQLLKGTPIEVDLIKVYPLTLQEIVNLGEEIYYRYLQNLMIIKSDVNKDFINPDYWNEFIKLDDYQFLMSLMIVDEEFKAVILSSLSLFLREKISFDVEKGLLIQRENEIYIITKDIFNRIKEIISQQNFLDKKQKEENEEFKPHDENARKLIEKINKYRKLKQEAEASDAVGLSDIISIVSSLSLNYNFDNVWNLTIYQLYSVYIRMGMKDNYDTQIYLLPHSSSDKSPEIKHWMSKINKNN